MTKKVYKTVKVEKENGITWVILNRPEKRNAMSPQLHFEMVDVLIELESDDETKVLVLTGAGDSWCAGQDLKEFFRELDDKPAERRRAEWATHEWRWRSLLTFPKPTIAMVNGYCFGGGFTQLIACDIAIAAEDAIFGLSEINFGIFPGGLVSRVIADAMSYRDAPLLQFDGGYFYWKAGCGDAAGDLRCSPREIERRDSKALPKADGEESCRPSGNQGGL